MYVYQIVVKKKFSEIRVHLTQRELGFPDLQVLSSVTEK